MRQPTPELARAAAALCVLLAGCAAGGPERGQRRVFQSAMSLARVVLQAGHSGGVRVASSGA
ncbi:MAG: hypothetical protein PVH68_00455 [Armatimonadota bacterium]|jgi:hypothetical protein